MSDTDDRTVFLYNDVSEESSRSAVQDLLRYGLESVSRPITLVVSTVGGSIHEMFAVYDAMRFVRAPVHTLGLGKIMSAGCLILAAGAPGKRFIGRHAAFMFHCGHGYSLGSVAEQRNELKEFERLEELYDRTIAKLAGRTYEDIKHLMKDGLDRYLTAEEAVDFGFADELIG